MRKKTFDIPIYEAKLTIIFDKDLSYVEKKYKTKNLESYGAVTFREPDKFKHYVVVFEYSDGSIIAHEIVHIINFLFIDVGIELDRINDENQAYLTSYLYKIIEKFLHGKNCYCGC